MLHIHVFNSCHRKVGRLASYDLIDEKVVGKMRCVDYGVGQWSKDGGLGGVL